MAEKIVQLAPLLGLIDAPFMNAIAEVGGFDEIFAPYMLADERSIPKPQVITRRFSEIGKHVNLVPQLLSNNANAFVAMANILYDLGYQKVNWNMGCPIKFVVEKGRGAALLHNLQQLERLLDDTIGRLKPELSVKIRLGFDSPDASTLCGSALTLNVAVRNVAAWSGDSAKAVRMASENPATVYGFRDLGVIAKGKLADLAVFDERFNAKEVFVGGKLALENR